MIYNVGDTVCYYNDSFFELSGKSFIFSIENSAPFNSEYHYSVSADKSNTKFWKWTKYKLKTTRMVLIEKKINWRKIQYIIKWHNGIQRI